MHFWDGEGDLIIDNVGLCEKLYSLFASNFTRTSAADISAVKQNIITDDGKMLHIIVD